MAWMWENVKKEQERCSGWVELLMWLHEGHSAQWWGSLSALAHLRARLGFPTCECGTGTQARLGSAVAPRALMLLCGPHMALL